VQLPRNTATDRPPQELPPLKVTSPPVDSNASARRADDAGARRSRSVEHVLTGPQPGLPGSQQPSPKSYAVSAALSAVFGFVGVQHFYLGRLGEGLLDVGLTIGWIWSLAAEEVFLAVVLILLDFGHSMTVTIMLLTGNFKDGDGRIVCYPGQKLKIHRG
jgi:TM2 domain-containing membrane protein YozV